MGMPLDKAFGSFGEARDQLRPLLDRTDGLGIVQSDQEQQVDMIVQLETLSDRMHDVQRDVEDALGGTPSSAVGEAKEAAQDVIDAAEHAANAIKFRNADTIVESLDELEQALDRGATYDWRANDHDPGGASGLIAHVRKTFAGEQLDPHFSGDSATRAEAEAKDLD